MLDAPTGKVEMATVLILEGETLISELVKEEFERRESWLRMMPRRSLFWKRVRTSSSYSRIRIRSLLSEAVTSP